MKKFNYFLGLGLLASMSLASCSSNGDEPAGGTNENGDGVAYIVVSIRESDNASRGTEGTGDDEFSYANATESNVGSAYFYFYDENGIFISQATAYNGQQDVHPGNINFKSTNVVMLKGLTSNQSPKYVVTVLNKPTNFNVASGSTLDDMEAMLSMAATDANSHGGTRNGDNFIMSTTTYPFQTVKEDGITVKAGDPLPKPFVTELVKANFVDDPTGDPTATPCRIYVERLAAKVSLGVRVKANAADRTGTDLQPVPDHPGVYKMKVTRAGDPNEEDDDDALAAEFVYIKFGKWGLTNTAKTSYMVKNYDETWVGFGDPDNFRSSWAKAWTYDDNAAAKYNRLSEKTLFGSASSYLVADGFESPLYCAENTHSGEFLDSHFNEVTTAVMLTARIYDDVDCTSSSTLVRHQGVLYKETSYIKYQLSALNKANELNFYKRTGTGTEGDPYVYTQVGEGDVTTKNVGSAGALNLIPTLAASTTLYERTGGSGTEEDPYTYAAITKGVDSLKANLANFNETAPAYRYLNGQMYYTIPIEHTVEIDPDQTNYSDGQYGVVRNHHYKLTITKLRNLGAGVYDPSVTDEPIIPDDPDKELYQVGAEINILSWKCVYQDNIEL